MKVLLSDLQPGQSRDEWFTLIPVNPTTKTEVGCLRVSIRYLHEILMPPKEYTGLKEVTFGRQAFDSILGDNHVYAQGCFFLRSCTALLSCYGKCNHVHV